MLAEMHGREGSGCRRGWKVLGDWGGADFASVWETLSLSFLGCPVRALVEAGFAGAVGVPSSSETVPGRGDVIMASIYQGRDSGSERPSHLQAHSSRLAPSHLLAPLPHSPSQVPLASPRPS